jgi:ABC-type Zn uptake system ZnuABC Zn-binding protein ZnuA
MAVLMVALLVGSVGVSAQDARIQVVTSFSVLHDFVTFIGGERVHVSNMVPFGECPCGWDPAPGDIRLLVGADLFIFLSEVVDPWVDQVVAAVGNPDLIVVEAALGAPLRIQDGAIDTHLWYDPFNAMLMANAILSALIEVDPRGREYFVANARQLQNQLRELDEEIRATVGGLPRREFIIWHQALDYFADRYGLVSHPVVKFWLDDPPPGRVAEIIALGRKLGVRYVFAEAPGEEIMDVIAGELGARMLLFTATPSPRAFGQETSAYVSLMRTFLADLRQALAP